MPESPTSSFIPKRGPGKKPVIRRSGNFVILSMVSYALFISAPLASAAVYIYERHTENQFNKAVVALDEAITSFKEEDLNRVVAFDERLSMSKKMLGSHVSVVTLLQTLEAATAQTVTFKDLDVSRASDASLVVSALLSTPALDGALFQRSTYTASDIIKSPLFTDVQIVQTLAQDTVAAEQSIEFKASFTFATGDILYKPLTPITETVPSEALTDIPVGTDTSNNQIGSTTSRTTI